MNEQRSRMWWWGIRLEVAARRWRWRAGYHGAALLLRVRPGLAPELTRRDQAPWLTRVAGRPVYRPIHWDAVLARAEQAILEVRIKLVNALTPALRQAMQAVSAFGEALASVKLPTMPTPGEDTAGK